ncbi:schwannomin-interacting protein 1, partial [Biomphalaria glabrata]
MSCYVCLPFDLFVGLVIANTGNRSSAIGKERRMRHERHIGGSKRNTDSCKNEREEIRKRLAMSTEDDISFGADEDSNETLETLSPRKQRLQARLQGAPSGMQICFMNDDVPDDDDEDELENSASNDQDDEELGKIK